MQYGRESSSLLSGAFKPNGHYKATVVSPHSTMSFAQNLQSIINFFFQIFLIFPYSALTIQRQRQLKRPIDTAEQSLADASRGNSAVMISDKVYKLCTSSESVSTLLAKDPTMAPGDAWKKLYGGYAAGKKESKATARAHRDTLTPEDLKRAQECGNWGSTQPSELFLRVCVSYGYQLAQSDTADLPRCNLHPG